MIHRLVLGTAVAVLGLAALAVVPHATAQEVIDSGGWAGSRLYRPEAITNSPYQTTISGSLQREDPFSRPVVTITFSADNVPAACPLPPGPVAATVVGDDLGRVYAFSAKITFSADHCNQRHAVSVDATSNPTVSAPASLHMTTNLDVVVAPQPVSEVSAVPDDSGRRVEVSWSKDTTSPADFVGYRVERMSDGGSATVATIDNRDSTSFTDTNPPAQGGTVEYRVSSRRSSPNGEVSSSPTSSSSIVVQPDPNPPPPGGDGGTDGAPGGDTGGTPGTGGAPTPGDGTTTPGRTIGTRVRPPLLGTGGFFPPLLDPIDPTTVTTADDGFSEELPFGDREPGEEDAVPPNDELALSYEDEANRGLIIPIATAIVMAVWAFHLRYLARASRPIE